MDKGGTSARGHSGDEPLWRPRPEDVGGALVTRFREGVERDHGVALDDHAALWRWSVEHPGPFWRSVWDFCGVVGEPGQRLLEDGERMPGARFFPDARLNFAENLLRRRDGSEALVAWDEHGLRRRLTWSGLYTEVARLAGAFRAAGLRPGDRVAAYLPNVPEAIVAMLAAASLGAVWCSCSPDFGVDGVLERFGQIEPKLLLAADGYRYGGKRFDVLDKVRAVSARLPTVERVVLVPVLEADPDLSRIPGAVTLSGFVADSSAGEIAFARLPFGHPLYVLFSSGTTGAPKCIVHGAGGTLLKHLTEHRHHAEVRPGDRLFYYTTLNWMMWNWLASGLASEATLVLYDGSPLARDGGVLFDLAETERLTHMGVSARFLHECRRKALRPRETHRLDALRVVLSTGSTLLPEGFDWVYESLKEDVCLSSISGGTDIVGGFVVGSPVLPVWRGEIQCRALGMAVESFDEQGRPVRGRSGELVCTKPFPSMPLGFWNDPDGSRYRAAYFERFPGVWTHGDWVEITEHDGVIIHGRSDAVLNPGGVRIGTAEIYRQVEQVEGVAEAVAIGQAWEGDTRIVLFVTLEDGAPLDEALRARIRERLRTHASPHHVPAKILQVSDIPRTRSGKVVELAVREVVEGRPVKNLEALANPEALEEFRGRAELAG